MRDMHRLQELPPELQEFVLKPSNVLVDDSGVPYVVDFGLARHVSESSGLTASDEFLGTPAYAAPEQIQAKRARAQEILDDLARATRPRFMRLTAKFFVRGGIFTTVVAEHRKKGWKPQPKVELDAFPAQSNTRF